ncbi:hypothetical protein LTR66_009386 [Elasticomyces elasticus]|nr:hypothetical protein LTR66_009386 [Elasticomyces elasticus]
MTRGNFNKCLQSATSWTRSNTVHGLQRQQSLLKQAGRARPIAIIRQQTAAASNIPYDSARRQQSAKGLKRRAVITAVVVAAATLTCATRREVHAEAPPKEPDKGERLIRLSEIHEHGRNAEKFWVFKGDRVYDITDWVPNHPGGEVILRAAGGDIGVYWDIFTIHKKQEVYDVLEQYFIGRLDPQDLVDGKPPSEHVDDPFSTDPERDKALIVRSSRPMNAETPASSLQTYLTPVNTFYVRNHLWVPDLGNGDGYRLTVEMIDGEEKQYSMNDLREKFKQHTITATLQCSGNRRAHMTAGSRQTNGLQWDVGAIGTAEWTGVRLRDVLIDAGLDVMNLDEDVQHAQFAGAEAYGASIPVDKAIDPRGDVLLAFEMNGQPLPRDHGFPLRVLVPGHVAARSVKWVNKITMSGEESTSQWQRRDYKCFGPNEGSNPDWDSARAIQEMPVQSAITNVRQVPQDRLNNSKLAQVYGLEEDAIILEGYAFSGGGREIVRVDISADDGRTWRQAQLIENDEKGAKAWSWKQWRIALPRREAMRYFCVKAVDEAYNTQPESFEAHYNFRGNLASGWHRVPVPKSTD